MANPTFEAFYIDGIRTPFGRYGGGLAGVRADDLAAVPIAALLARHPAIAARLGDVIMGCANQAGEDNRNVARMALLLAGVPVSVPGITVNRLCGSGMQAIIDATRMVKTGEADVVIAGGVESMSRAPLVMGKPEAAYPRGNQTLYDTTLGWRFVNPKMTAAHETLAMGETAERVAQQCGVTREAQDAFALRSQQRAGAAQASGRLAKEICPVTVGVDKKSGKAIVIDADEHLRADTTLEQLQKLKPLFASGVAGVDPARGSVTAGNASGLNDGAAAVIIANERAIAALGLTPRARYVAGGAAGVAPSLMGLGPVPASQHVLARAGLTAAQIDLAELNEAFAAQALPCVAQLGLDPDKVNVNGGAIALGHPLGASGARLVLTLVTELGERYAAGANGTRYGLASMCIGVGQGIASVWERV
ncbi:MAG: acetyl-CoA C-acyltransferase [Myxococcales bacterium]|nr:acetyl-CoA C-acyltransferase [Myxococcales bacterium]